MGSPEGLSGDLNGLWINELVTNAVDLPLKFAYQNYRDDTFQNGSSLVALTHVGGSPPPSAEREYPAAGLCFRREMIESPGVTARR